MVHKVPALLQIMTGKLAQSLDRRLRHLPVTQAVGFGIRLPEDQVLGCGIVHPLLRRPAEHRLRKDAGIGIPQLVLKAVGFMTFVEVRA
jgi:hypothetical protein